MTSVFAVRGEVSRLSARNRSRLLNRTFDANPALQERVAEILAHVQREGDEALREMARELDRVELEELEVPLQACTRALDALDPALRRAMQRAADNIATVHLAVRVTAAEVEPEPGVIVGSRPDPLDRVGVYAPGGRAPYPSSVLMGAIAARVAGVREIVLCSPPQKDSGRPADVVLAAAALSEVDRVFAGGGAGAIAALAYGTQSVPRVDLIVGPGNAYVAEAKAQVASIVATDAPAGPSELLVIADASSTPELIARELLAQAEHDPNACAVCITVDANNTAVEIERAIQTLLADEPRATIITASLETRGAILTAESLDEAVTFANAFAPEHLLLAVKDPDVLLPQVRSAGTVFLGESASVVFGDYMTGANHVLPTAGLARSRSGLSPLDFVRWTTYQRVSPQAARRLAGDVATFADAEGLPAHARAARAWQTSRMPAEVTT